MDMSQAAPEASLEVEEIALEVLQTCPPDQDHIQFIRDIKAATIANVNENLSLVVYFLLLCHLRLFQPFHIKPNLT
jgi:hypothetical protein